MKKTIRLIHVHDTHQVALDDRIMGAWGNSTRLNCNKANNYTNLK